MPRAADLYRHLLARRAYLVDAALALVLVLLTVPRVLRTDPGAADQVLAVWWTFTAVIVVGLLVQHRWPLTALTLTSIGAFAHVLVRDLGGPDVGFPLLIHLAVPITLYTLAGRSRTRRLPAIALAVLMTAQITVSLLGPMLAREPAKAVPDGGQQVIESDGQTKPEQTSFTAVQNKIVAPGVTMLLALALAYALGEGTRSRHAHLRTLEQRAADLERQQHQRVALATATERTRISRELHDVVAHSLSVIVAQAQAGLAAQPRRPERTTQAMREIIAVGRESLSEMRRVVGALGPDPGQGIAPQIGVAALPALVERVRAAGVAVRLAVDGPPADLPAAVDLSAYRIVQEALTNTLKHAGDGAQASVRLTVRSEYVDIEITDDGAGRPAGPPSGHGNGPHGNGLRGNGPHGNGPHGNGLRGNGLRGIAERVSLLGGTLTVGPDPNGGFAVRARLPVTHQGRTRPERIGIPG